EAILKKQRLDMNAARPFGRGGDAFFADRFAIDETVCERLLGHALSRGGDYAELYFEHRESGSIVYEDQRVTSAGGGVIQGLGVRVIHGDGIGYAYTEDFTFEAMRQAAETAARISSTGERSRPLAVKPIETPSVYPVLNPTTEVAA